LLSAASDWAGLQLANTISLFWALSVERASCGMPLF
jgi:hypothetical protein